MIANAPSAEHVLKEVVGLTSGVPFVAHNASFDMKFLTHEADKAGLRIKPESLCTLLLSRRVFPSMPNHKLGTLAGELGLRADGNLHRALVDADITARLFLKIMSELAQKSAASAVRMDYRFLKQIESSPKQTKASSLASTKAVVSPKPKLDPVISSAKPAVKPNGSSANVCASIELSIALIAHHHLNIEVSDFRDRGGAYWIAHKNNADDLSKQLRQLGFCFFPSRGFWIK